MRKILFTCIVVGGVALQALAGTVPGADNGNDHKDAVDNDAQQAPPQVLILRDKVLVPVSLNGVGPYMFVLDFAAPVPVLSNDVATYLNLAAASGNEFIVHDGAGHGATVSPVQVGQFQCDTFTASGVTFNRMDLSLFAPQLGVAVGGVFSGREFGVEMVFDPGRNSLLFRDAAHQVLTTDPGASGMPVRFTPLGIPVVQVVVDSSHVLDAAIDLTFGGVFGVPVQSLKDWGVFAETTPRIALAPEKDGTPASMPMGSTQIRLQDLRIGSLDLQNPVCSVVPAGEMPRIGLGVLRRCIMTLNFQQAQVRLESSQNPLMDPPVTGFGLTPRRFDGFLWSVWVAKGSPADRAGIESGARILSVNGKSTQGLSLQEFTSLLMVPAEGQATVIVAHGDQPRTILLKSEKLL